VIELVGRGVLSPVISEVLPLRDAAEAHRTMEDRRQFGKVLLAP
jgi:NADPH:quinone reductase-like Zn-dependent oxidoreductase